MRNVRRMVAAAIRDLISGSPSADFRPDGGIFLKSVSIKESPNLSYIPCKIRTRTLNSTFMISSLGSPSACMAYAFYKGPTKTRSGKAAKALKMKTQGSSWRISCVFPCFVSETNGHPIKERNRQRPIPGKKISF